MNKFIGILCSAFILAGCFSGGTMTYTVDGMYSFEYPSDGWEIVEEEPHPVTGITKVTLVHADPEAPEGVDSQKFQNAAKVEVYVADRAGRGLEEVVDSHNNAPEDVAVKEEGAGRSIDFVRENLMLNGRGAIRVSMNVIGPSNKVYIDFNQTQYAVVSGVYGQGTMEAELLEDILYIQESFESLQ